MPPLRTSLDSEAIAFSKNLNHIPHCEEYDKMISGMLYNPFTPKLISRRYETQRLCHEYNNYFPQAPVEEILAARLEKLKNIMGHLGERPMCEPPLKIDFGSNISIGDDFFSNFGLTILDTAIVRIGNRVFLATNVSLITAAHTVDIQERRDNIEYGLPIEIGDDCWLGANVTVLPGVKIGRGCTIGAGSVVTKDIPEFSVAVGVPARVIKKVRNPDSEEEEKKDEEEKKGNEEEKKN